MTERDNLYLKIKEHGYNRQPDPEREIEVGVSRNGEILFIDGRHRLALTFLLNIKEIPVVVNIWNREYIEKVAVKTHNPKITPRLAIEATISEFSNNRKEQFSVQKRLRKN